MAGHLRGLWRCAVMALACGCGFEVKLGQPAIDDGGTDARTTDATELPIDASALTLVNRGLVARYFLDEAASGQAGATVTDSATQPLGLPITYGQATYTEVAGNRGLNWPAAQSTGKIELNLGTSTKFRTRLTVTTRITIELVVQITGSGVAGSESQLAGMRGGNPDFMLTSLNTTDLRFFRPFGDEGATWTNANAQQRMVLHLVYDSSRATASERIELYRDGVVVAKTTSSPPSMNQTVGLISSDAVMIGNRQGSDRSIRGTIFYVAYYDAALAAGEISNNAQRLLVNDDL